MSSNCPRMCNFTHSGAIESWVARDCFAISWKYIRLKEMYRRTFVEFSSRNSNNWSGYVMLLAIWYLSTSTSTVLPIWRSMLSFRCEVISSKSYFASSKSSALIQFCCTSCITVIIEFSKGVHCLYWGDWWNCSNPTRQIITPISLDRLFLPIVIYLWRQFDRWIKPNWSWDRVVSTLNSVSSFWSCTIWLLFNCSSASLASIWILLLR